MPNFISITSGSKPILLKIIKEHPAHDLRLYKSNTEDTFSLIDWQPKKLIFKTPITYQLIKVAHPTKRPTKGPFLNLFYFTLSQKELKVLLAYVNKLLASGLPSWMSNLFMAHSPKNSSKIVMGLICSNNKFLVKWIHFSFISQFLNNPSNYGFNNNLVQIR